MQLGVPGTKRITAQQHLLPSNTAIRVYSVSYESAVTSTNLYLCNNDGTNASSTVTALALIGVHAHESNIGNWNGGCHGVLFNAGVLVFTSTNFKFASVTYSTEL